MSKSSPVIGIDLGTTNSEVAAYFEGQVQVLRSAGQAMLPSCVGLSPSGELLVGEPARNQLLLYPERTVRSIKRKMGSSETVQLGDQTFTPAEISALILGQLVRWASDALGQRVSKAAITVPAYFSDAQRQATKEAGTLAGLEVLRILNEPTAASLAYGYGQSGRQTAMIYDLGGGTFDVSIVNFEDDVTEVLSSHGNNRLGGDDFDQALLELLLEKFKTEHGVDLTEEGHAKALARLRWAAEQAKRELSFSPFTQVREQALCTVKRKALHLDLEISRSDLEALLRPMLMSTLESVSKTLDGAKLTPRQLDAVLLVGGSTRIPLVSSLLEEAIGLTPRQEVDPDLAVALGAGTLASRLSGHQVGQVLVDVSPFSFGVSFLGLRGGYPYPHCYKAIIPRNTPLPLTRTELFHTATEFQETVVIEVFQGEDEDALKNIPLAEMTVEGLTPIEEPNAVLCRMSLNLDGILEVTATEKVTGLSKHVIIEGASRPPDEEQLAMARLRLRQLQDPLWDEDETDEELEESAAEPEVEDEDPTRQRVLEVLDRLHRASADMHPDDLADAEELRQRMDTAMAQGELEQVESLCLELSELLFFVETAKA